MWATTAAEAGSARRQRLGGFAASLLACTALTTPSPSHGAAPPQDGRSAPAALSLEEQFRNPPASARPRAWWHWMNGNVSEDGIAKDLAWMSRVGTLASKF